LQYRQLNHFHQNV